MYASLSLNELILVVYNFVSFSACDYAIITIISLLAPRLRTEKQELRSPSTRAAWRKLGPPHWWEASRTWMIIKALLCLVSQNQNTPSKLIEYHACLLTDGMLAKILIDLFYAENFISIYIYICIKTGWLPLSFNLEFFFNSLSITDVVIDQWLWSTYIQVNGMLPEWWRQNIA